jgi:hypothetical protein
MKNLPKQDLPKVGTSVPGEVPADPSRRKFLKTTATAAVVAAAGSSVLTKYAHAATGRPIKIGFVTPETGPPSAKAVG